MLTKKTWALFKGSANPSLPSSPVQQFISFLALFAPEPERQPELSELSAHFCRFFLPNAW